MKRIWTVLLTCVLVLGMLAGCGSREEEKPAVKMVQRGADTTSGLEKKEDKGKGDKKADKKSEKGESILDDAEVFDDGEEDQTGDDSDVSIVIEGIKVCIPGEYGCFIEETKGPIVYRDDLFTLLIAVRDRSYEEEMKNPEGLMEGAARVGGEIIKEIEEIEIKGKKYAYYKYTDGEDDFIVVYTAAPDQDRRLCAQLLIRSGKETDEELLGRFADIAASAVETDEADTTQESLNEAKRLARFGEKKEESTLVFDGVKITFQVEPELYSTFEDSDEYSSCEFFTNPDDYRTLDCTLMPAYEQGAEAYVENQFVFWDEKGIKAGSVKVDGYTFYYAEARYTSEGNEFQRILAACDIGDGCMYTISATAMDVDDRIELDDYEAFMKVKEQ